MSQMVSVFAPASVANLGPGLDILGVAVSGLGDRVTAWCDSGHSGVVIKEIDGEQGRLPRDATKNTAGIAAQGALKLLGKADAGIVLRIQKGLPLASGLGSSAASACAAAWAVNLLFGKPLSKRDLLPAVLEAEVRVSGLHADNVGASLLGGCVLVRSYDPLEIIQLPVPVQLLFVLVTPRQELSTKDARGVLPTRVEVKQEHVRALGNVSALVAALFLEDIPLLGRATEDVIAERARGPLIPGFHEVKHAALEAGAAGCSISGSGPTVFAVTDDQAIGKKVALAMKRAFKQAGHLDSTYHLASADMAGAKEVPHQIE